jgi:hypothetical protein
MPLSSEINPEDGGSMFLHNCDTVNSFNPDANTQEILRI